MLLLLWIRYELVYSAAVGMNHAQLPFTIVKFTQQSPPRGLTLPLTGRRRAKRGGNPRATLLGAPVERLVRRHLYVLLAFAVLRFGGAFLRARSFSTAAHAIAASSRSTLRAPASPWAVPASA
jgi:hypothetical protein